MQAIRKRERREHPGKTRLNRGMALASWVPFQRGSTAVVQFERSSGRRGGRRHGRMGWFDGGALVGPVDCLADLGLGRLVGADLRVAQEQALQTPICARVGPTQAFTSRRALTAATHVDPIGAADIAALKPGWVCVYPYACVSKGGTSTAETSCEILREQDSFPLARSVGPSRQYRLRRPATRQGRGKQEPVQRFAPGERQGQGSACKGTVRSS